MGTASSFNFSLSESDVESEGGAKQAAMYNLKAGLNRQHGRLGGRG